MSTKSPKCYLQCLKTNKQIALPDQKLVKVGRNPETGLTDTFLSRTQLECTADFASRTVLVTPVGRTASGANGLALVKNNHYNLKHGDFVELRLCKGRYEIVFESATTDSAENKPKTATPFSIFQKTNSPQVKTAVAANGIWDEINNKELLIFTAENCEAKPQIAAFDVDGTIIKTKSGARFPKNADDWLLLYNEVPTKLAQLNQSDYKIVFFTNQSGVGKDPYKIQEFKRKIENIVAKLSLPIQVFIATQKTMYRKPIPGMWNALAEEKNGDIAIAMDKCFYVGDAAGRDKNWAPKRSKDHSKADRLFALNLGLKFYTPEEYFLKQSPAKFMMPDFIPKNTLDSVLDKKYPDVDFAGPNVIVMVGGPGSGKSTYAKSELVPKGYTYVNRDTLGTWQKCVQMMGSCLEKNESVVIDNTNPDKGSRKRFVEVAQKFGVDCRCFWMEVDSKQAKHNNKFREIIDRSHVQVGEIIINSYYKNFENPDVAERFKEIVRVPFIPKFDNAEHKKLYSLFLLET